LSNNALKSAVEIRQGFDTLAGAGRRQRQAKAKGVMNRAGVDKICLFPQALSSASETPIGTCHDHAKLSVIHRDSFRLSKQRIAQSHPVPVNLQHRHSDAVIK